MPTFLRDEDAALKQKLSGITVSDLNNATRSVDVWFRRPQKEVRDTIFPFILIDFVDYVFTPERFQPTIWDPVAYLPDGWTPDGNPNTGSMLRTAIPVDLVYSVAVHSRNPLHDRALLRELSKVNRLPFKFGWLEVPSGEDGTDPEDTIRRLDVLGVTPADYKDPNGYDVFRKVWTVVVGSEILSNLFEEDEAPVFNPLVTTTTTNVTASSSNDGDFEEFQITNP